MVGIELGSTRIKACLIDPQHPDEVLATDSQAWENDYREQTWTYSETAIWSGLQAAFTDLLGDTEERYGARPTALAGVGISAMMHGYLAFDDDDRLLVPFRTWRNTSTGPVRIPGRRSRSYPADPVEPGRPAPATDHLRETRMVEPRRQQQGPSSPVHDPGGRGRRAAAARRDRGRTDQRQHWDRTLAARSTAGLPGGDLRQLDHLGREAAPDHRLRCATAADRQLRPPGSSRQPALPCRTVRGADAGCVVRRPVRQRGQSAGPSAHHRTGDLGRHRGSDHPSGGDRRHRRDHQRHRSSPETGLR
nr:FGGY family carbohydrate kinase [Naumannella halotolerans]